MSDPAKPDSGPTKPDQDERLTEIARDLGSDGDEEAYVAAFKRVLDSRHRPKKEQPEDPEAAPETPTTDTET